MSADISPMVKAVSRADADHGYCVKGGITECRCGAFRGARHDYYAHRDAEVAKAAMDAARPIILREAGTASHAAARPSPPRRTTSE